MHPIVVLHNCKWTQLPHMCLYIAHGNMTSWHTYMVSVCSLLHRSDMFRYYSVYVLVCTVYICLCALRCATWCYVVLATCTPSGNCVHFQQGGSTHACMSSAGNQSSMEHCCLALLFFSLEEGHNYNLLWSDREEMGACTFPQQCMDELSHGGRIWYVDSQDYWCDSWYVCVLITWEWLALIIHELGC